MSSYSPVTESFAHEMHPSVPAPSTFPAAGHWMTFAQRILPPLVPHNLGSVLRSFHHNLGKAKSHIKNIFLSDSVIYTKTDTLINEE